MLNFDLYEIFKEKLITKSSLESLWDLMEDDSIIFNQYYQRQYVWNSEKASNFIESIILGFDIPPIVIFEENGNNSEIIDGRQRFETIKRFINNEFKLKRCGLSVLKIYNDKYFKDLEEQVQNYIKNAYLRIFRYKLSSNLSRNKELTDAVKKEIFRRYNIGLTPLKQFEIEKAIFIRNNLNEFIKKNLTSNPALIKNISEMFCKECSNKDELTTKTVEILMKKIRFLMTLAEIPINYYSWSPNKNDLINSVFKYISNDTGANTVYKNFKDNIALLNRCKKVFEKRNLETNHTVYEALYWIISVIKRENLDIQIFENNIQSLANSIQENIALFNCERGHYYKNIISRYLFVANWAKELYNADFDGYITTSDFSKAKIKEARDTQTKKKIRKYLSKINNSKPDSQSITIKTYLNTIQRSTFNLRPDYQRDDSMNKQKASGLIESILLDFKIAPIYIYSKKDGEQEVIDGQQRLLTILGFIGLPYMDKKRRRIYTNNNGFKLTGLKYLKEYNGLTYAQLPEEAQKRIKSFSLTIIELKEENAPKFDPVDLFIRLNNKPYPIKEHSFEMWNASVCANITEQIKKINEDNSDWFYFRNKTSNRHMQNEEMITTLLFFEHTRKNTVSLLSDNPCDKFRIYTTATRFSSSIKNRKEISQLLEDITDSNEHNLANECIKNTCDYIEKLKTLLQDDGLPLKQRLNELICPNKGTRALNIMFLLWYIIAPIESNMIAKHKGDIFEAVKNIIQFYKTEYREEERTEMRTALHEKLHNFWTSYSHEKYKIGAV